LIMKRKEDIRTILIPCECSNELMEITRADWDTDTDYYIHFKSDCFSSGQGIFRNLTKRIKFAWEALMKGSYVHEEIIVTRESLEEMRKDIEELLKEPDVDHGYKIQTI